MTPSEYCSRVGLDVPTRSVEAARAQLLNALDDAKLASLPSTPNSLAKLYQFKVPALGPNDAEGLYDLAEVLKGRSLTSTTRLMTLDVLVAYCEESLEASRVGVYQARETQRGSALVKLAGRGVPSRAELPLTDEFAAKNQQSAAALSGRAKVVNDLPAWFVARGESPMGDPALKAEACLPVLSEKGVIGLVDAAHVTTQWFTPQRLALFIALALELPSLLPSEGLTLS